MKRMLIAVVLAAAGIVAYNIATTGSASLVPWKGTSAEDRALRDLERRFEDAKAQFAQAHRAAAVGGVDTTSDAEATQAAVRLIERDLAALRKTLTEPSAVHHGEELSRAVEEFARRIL